MGSGSGAGRRDPAVRSVQRATHIMQALLRAAPRGLRVSELSRETGLHKTTVVRLLRTLSGLNLVRQDERTVCYMWEPLAWVTLMNNIRSLLSPVEGVETVLRGLAKAVDETVILAYPDAMARHMGITAYALPDKAMKIDPRAWRIAPMHCSTAGKAYLTGKSGVELEAWARPGLPPVTPRSMTSVQALSGDIARARDQGYAVAIEERVLGTAEVGVPVRDDRDNVVGGLQVCARAELVTEQHIKQWARLLADASVKLTAIFYIVGAGDPNLTTHLGGVGQGGSNAESGGTERNRRPYRVV